MSKNEIKILKNTGIKHPQIGKTSQNFLQNFFTSKDSQSKDTTLVPNFLKEPSSSSLNFQKNGEMFIKSFLVIDVKFDIWVLSKLLYFLVKLPSCLIQRQK